MKIQVRRLAIALAIAGPLAVATTAKSSGAPINGLSIKAAVSAVTTDVRYRAYRDNPYPSDWGYPTYNNYGYHYGYLDYSTYSRSWGYPRGGSVVHVGNGGFRGAQSSIGSVGASAADASYCRQRWAYYNPASGMYMGDDGEWHPCR